VNDLEERERLVSVVKAWDNYHKCFVLSEFIQADEDHLELYRLLVRQGAREAWVADFREAPGPLTGDPEPALWLNGKLIELKHRVVPHEYHPHMQNVLRGCVMWEGVARVTAFVSVGPHDGSYPLVGDGYTQLKTVEREMTLPDADVQAGGARMLCWAQAILTSVTLELVDLGLITPEEP
jgi:hypothetical protein